MCTVASRHVELVIFIITNVSASGKTLLEKYLQSVAGCGNDKNMVSEE